MVEKKVKLTEVKFDSSIYPRLKPSSSVIEDYLDVLKSGKELPPIVLEEGTNRLLDGYHRWKAYWRYFEEKGDPKQGEIIAQIVSLDGLPPLLYSASLNSAHGLRLSPAERKEIARKVFQENPDIAVEKIAESLGVSRSTAYSYISDLIAKRKEELKAKIFCLRRLGWTQSEIAEVLGCSQQYVSEILPDFPELEKIVKKTLSQGISQEEVAKRFNIPLQLVWAIDLDSLSDQEKVKKLGIKVQPYDVWQFHSCNPLFGREYPGRIPGELVVHVLYFFTEPGDLVFDPMAGSGTVVDACLVMGRKCYAYDIDNRHSRYDILKHNLADGWPERVKKAKLIFWDPPYFSKKDSEYVEGSISSFSREKYLKFFQNRLAELKKLVRKDTIVAFLMSDWDDPESRQGIFIWDYADIFRKTGWKLIRHIQVPLSTQQVHPDIVKRFRKEKRLARLERYLLVAVS